MVGLRESGLAWRLEGNELFIQGYEEALFILVERA